MIQLPHNLAKLRAAWRVTAEVTERTTPCFRVSNAEGERAKLYVYDVIGGWDLDSGEFVQAVHAITAPAIDMHVNSPGGFVYDGVAMFEAVKSHPATVTTHIDGLAASAASFLSLAADPYDAKADAGGVRIAKAGRMMIHDAQGVGMGSPADFREYADMLDAVSNDISGYYADKAGGTSASWRAAMSATTWYSAQQAVDVGLADALTGAESNTAGTDDRVSQLIRARARVALGGVK